MFSDSEFFYSNKYLKYLTGGNVKNINQLVILTVPHETCIDHIDHYCDYYANKLAMSLKNVLFKKYDITIVHGNINRLQIDLNRIQSRNTKFREKIREIVNQFNIKNKSNNIIYIIDCHSFPFEKSGEYDFATDEVKDPQTTILYDTAIERKYANILESILRTKNINVTNLPGIHNDIIDEFSNIHKHDLHIIPILIEVREDLTNKQLNDVANSVDQWITTINKDLFDK